MLTEDMIELVFEAWHDGLKTKPIQVYMKFLKNNSKCEICGIGVKKGDKTALCGFRNVDLTTDSIKVLGVYFSYNDLVCLEKKLS